MIELKLILVETEGRLFRLDLSLLSNTNDAPILNQIELIGHVEGGLECVQWSPDEELVVLVSGTEKRTVILLTHQFEPISEIAYEDTTERAIEQPVNVGWGSKETQFIGAGQRALLRQEKNSQNDTSSVENNMQVQDDQKVLVSWRGDASKFCVSYYDRVSSRRLLKIYNRELLLLSKGEVKENEILKPALNWKPAGNFIASAVKKSTDLIEIVFFEPNGLRHREFLLKARKDFNIKSLAWNCDSSILLIQFYSTRGDGVQLWCVSNYHWELKLDLFFQKETIINVSWDNEDPDRFYYSTLTQIAMIKISKKYSSLQSIDGLSVVIDGSTLNFTPYRWAIYPPPMFAKSLNLQEYFPKATQEFGACLSVHVLYCPELEMYLLTCLSNLGFILVFKILLHRKERPVKLEFEILREIKVSGFPLSCRCIDGESICVLTSNGKSTDIYKCTFTTQVVIETILLENSDIYCISTFNQQVYGISPQSLYQLVENELVRSQALPSSATTVDEVLPLSGSNHYVFFDKKAQKIYIDSTFFLAGISSMLVSKEYLIVTTVLFDHQILFFSLIESGKSNLLVETFQTKMKKYGEIKAGIAQNPTKNLSFEDGNFLLYFERKLERGGLLVSLIEDDPTMCRGSFWGEGINLGALILQMPRGNLEVTNPRPLLLVILKELVLVKCDHLKAYLFCRRHKMDMNLLVDIPTFDLFIRDEYLTQFINAIERPDYLNVFLGSLAKYSEIKSISGGGGEKNSGLYTTTDPGASRLLFLAIRGTLKKLYCQDPAYIDTLLTTWLMEKPSIDYPSMLEFLVASLHGASVTLCSSIELLNHAFKYILMFVLGEDLFKATLSSGHYQLTPLVAKYCQKDPSEYMPLLDAIQHELQSTPEARPWKASFLAHQYLGNDEVALEKLFEGWSLVVSCNKENVIGTSSPTSSKTSLLASLRSPALINDKASEEKSSQKVLEREIITFIAAKKLSTFSVSLLKKNSNKLHPLPSLYLQIYQLHGDYLSAKNEADPSAGLYYLMAKESALSMKVFLKSSSHPKLVVNLLKHHISNRRERESILADYATLLRSRGQHLEGALIMSNYLGDDETAVKSLCDQLMTSYSENLVQLADKPTYCMAIVDIIMKSERFDLVAQYFIPAIKSRLTYLMQLLESRLTQWRECSTRLTNLRSSKLEKLRKIQSFKEKFQLNEQVGFDEVISLMNQHLRLQDEGDELSIKDDGISQASTLMSITSKHTFHTQRSGISQRSGMSTTSRRTKSTAVNPLKLLERKRKAAMKVGSPFEEWYILDVLLNHCREIRHVSLLLEDLCKSVEQCPEFHLLTDGGTEEEFLLVKYYLDMSICVQVLLEWQVSMKKDLAVITLNIPELPIGSTLNQGESEELLADLLSLHYQLCFEKWRDDNLSERFKFYI